MPKPVAAHAVDEEMVLAAAAVAGAAVVAAAVTVAAVARAAARCFPGATILV